MSIKCKVLSQTGFLKQEKKKENINGKPVVNGILPTLLLQFNKYTMIICKMLMIGESGDKYVGTLYYPCTFFGKCKSTPQTHLF